MSAPEDADWLNLRDPEFYRSDPQDTWRRLRETDGLVRDRNGYVALARHADVLAAERRSAEFVSGRGYRFDHHPNETTMISQDDPGHLAQRRRLTTFFTPRAVGCHHERYAAMVAEMLDAAGAEVDARGSVEVVNALAAQLPCRITAAMIGFGEDMWPEVKDWSERQMRIDAVPDDPEIFLSFLGSIQEWAVEIDRLVPERQANPTDDFLSRWLHPPDGQPPMARDDMVQETGLLIAGGAETTRTAIGHGLRTFVDHPDQWEAMAADPDLVPGAVDEVIRWVSPLNNMFRTTSGQTDLNGVTIAEGERVALLYPSANRDPAVFDDADQFDIARESNEHLAFGHGTHFCLGANLARLELRLLFGAMSQRFTDLRVVNEPDIEPNVFARAVRSFELAFTPR